MGVVGGLARKGALVYSTRAPSLDGGRLMIAHLNAENTFRIWIDQAPGFVYSIIVLLEDYSWFLFTGENSN